MSLMKILAAYDNEREAYIRKLEARIEVLESECHASTDLMMKGESLRSKIMMDAILAGAYGRDSKPAASKEEGPDDA